MHAVIDFLKNAVDRNSSAGVTGCYVVKDGNMYARNDMLQAGIAFPTDLEFNVPAAELESAISRMKEVQEINFNDNVVTVKGGRVRAAISCVISEPPYIPPLPDTWQAMPAGLIPALKIASLFTGENGWNAGIRLTEDCVTAVNNASGVMIDVPGMNVSPLLLTDGCVKFLLKVDSPTEYATTEDAILFRWEDGRWLRAQLLAGEMPAVVDNIFSSLGNSAPVEITSDFRASFEDVAALVEGSITLRAAAVSGGKGHATTDVLVSTGVPDDHQSSWSAKVMAPVVQSATHWNPESYPNPSLWIGPNMRGVIVGVVES